MKVAIVHDWMTSLGGGERVVLTLARALGAEIVTTEVDPSVARNAGFEDVKVRAFARLPRTHPWRAIAATRAFSRLTVEGVDAVVLSGNWALHAARRNRPNLYYCYTPTRVFYDLREEWLAGLPRAQRPFARVWTRVHRRWNEGKLPHVDRIVTLSESVRGRIRRDWGRESVVVHPPVATERYRFDEVGDFWLDVARLSHEKRLEDAMEVFRRLPNERLVVVGGAPRGTDREAFIRALDPPPNVEFRDTVPEAELIRLYAACRGVLSTSIDEDFGISAVEANASGKVIVARDGGGFRESQVDGVTGFLLPPRPEAFVERISSLTTPDLESRAPRCIAQARRFDASVFAKKMRAEVVAVAGGAGR